MSAGLARAVPALHGPALHHHGLDSPESLGSRRLARPPQGLKHGVTLIGRQRELGKGRRRVAEEIAQEIRIDHDPPDQVAETLRIHTPPWIRW